jgi:hypothetical protein
MLVQAGYPPAVILAEERRRYLQALATADAGNPNPLAEVVARAVSGTLNRFLIPKLAGEAKLVPLSALAAQSRYSPVYLRRRALEGKLKAIRDGHLWLNDLCVSNVLVRYTPLWEVRHAPTGEPG